MFLFSKNVALYSKNLLYIQPSSVSVFKSGQAALNFNKACDHLCEIQDNLVTVCCEKLKQNRNTSTTTTAELVKCNSLAKRVILKSPS